MGTHPPASRVTPEHAITAHREGALPYLFDGNRFFAVRLTITNRGKVPWVSQPGTTAQATDGYNTPHPAEGVMQIREGRVLASSIRLAPGHSVRGYVVFQVSRTVPITGVTLTVGPGAPRTATWSIDRQ